MNWDHVVGLAFIVASVLAILVGIVVTGRIDH